MTGCGTVPSILLAIENDRDRDLLETWFDEAGDFSTVTRFEAIEDGHQFDLAVVDGPSFKRNAPRLERSKAAANPVFLPVLLVHAGDRSVDSVTSHDAVDDVIRTPIMKVALGNRVRNLLERRRLSRELFERFERSEERFRRIFESSNDAIFVVDPDDDRLVECNPAACALVGYDRDDLLDVTPSEDLHPDDSSTYRDFVRSVLEEGRGRSNSLVYCHREGRRLVAEVSAARIETASGRSVILCARDVTLRKRRRQQVQILDRVLRHNIRNDVNVIQGSAQTLLEPVEATRPEDHLERIIDRSRALIDLSRKTRELHQFVDWQEDPRSVDVVDVIESVTDEADESYAEASLDVSVPDQAMAVADERLERAIHELIDNAVRHADVGEPTVEVSVTVEGDRVWIRIADPGPGIPEQELAVIEGEETPLHHGSGLGLWLVNWIVTSVGGSFEIEDDEPRGSVVTITLSHVTEDGVA